MNALDALARKDRNRKVIVGTIACIFAALCAFNVVENTRTNSSIIWCSVPMAVVSSLASYSSCDKRMESICGAFLFALILYATVIMGSRLVYGYETWWIGPTIGLSLGVITGMSTGSFFGAFWRAI